MLQKLLHLNEGYFVYQCSHAKEFSVFVIVFLAIEEIKPQATKFGVNGWYSLLLHQHPIKKWWKV